MDDKPSPYKNSIWIHDDDSYDIEDIKLDDTNRRTIARMMSVNAAKMNIPMIPIKGLLAISTATQEMPPTLSVEVKNVEDFLDAQIKHHGAGIPTLICMLAVETNGDYAPMDAKFAEGLFNKKVITDSELEALTGKDIKNFAKTYVEKVLPVWIETRKEKTSKQADDYWGRGGEDG